MKRLRLSSLTLAALLSVPAWEARAALYEGVIGGAVSADADIHPATLAVGTPITVRFTFDSDQAPAPTSITDPDVLASLVYSETGNRAATWLSLDVSIDGVVHSIAPMDEIGFFQVRTDGDGDVLGLEVARCDPDGAGDCTVAISLDARVNSADFGAGDPFWTDLDVIPTYPSIGIFREQGPGTFYSFDIQFNSLSVHPVPEPALAALLGVLALPLLRRR